MKHSDLKTGYFANEKTYTKVHIVRKDNEKPICGAKVANDKKFLFNAGTVIFSYIECEHCKNIIKPAYKSWKNNNKKL